MLCLALAMGSSGLWWHRGVWVAADGQTDGQMNFRGSALQATPQLLQPDSHHPQLFPVLLLRRLLRCFCL